MVCGMVALFEYYFAEEPREEARKVASAVDEDDESDEEPPPPVEKKAGLFDGLDLVLRHSYVFNLLMISTLYEIVLTVLDFEMKIVGRARYGAEARPWSARGAHCGKSRRSTSASIRWSTSSCRQFRKRT